MGRRPWGQIPRDTPSEGREGISPTGPLLVTPSSRPDPVPCPRSRSRPDAASPRPAVSRFASPVARVEVSSPPPFAPARFALPVTPVLLGRLASPGPLCRAPSVPAVLPVRPVWPSVVTWPRSAHPSRPAVSPAPFVSPAPPGRPAPSARWPAAPKTNWRVGPQRQEDRRGGTQRQAPSSVVGHSARGQSSLRSCWP